MAKPRFYTDEHIAKAVIRGLRQRGVDVLTAPEAGLLRASDLTHLARATSELRVVISQDEDFLRLAEQVGNHAGVAFARQGTSIGAIIRGAMLIHDLLEDHEMVNRVEFL